MQIRPVPMTLALAAAALWLHAGCGPSKYQLGLKEEEARVARVAVYSGGVETRAADPLGVNQHLVVEARAVNAVGNALRNEAVTFASSDAEVLEVLATWAAWPSYFAAVSGEKAGTAEVVCSAGGVSNWLSVAVSDTAVATARPFIRFLAPDATPIPVAGSRVFAAEYVQAGGSTKETSLVFTLSNANVAKIASSDKISATLTGLATGEVQLLVRDAESTAAAGLSLSVR